MNKTTNYPTWKRLSTKTIWDKRMHIVEDYVVLPNGEHSSYIYEQAKGAAATLILIGDKLLLSYQYRYPLDRWIYDMPGGGMMEHESPEETARRECQEEIGMVPRELVHLATFHPNPARTAWPMHVFFCSVVDTTASDEAIEHEASEVVHKVLVPVKKLELLIQSGEIVDPSLLIAWYSARNRGLI